jgi:hypothetical protein
VDHKFKSVGGKLAFKKPNLDSGLTIPPFLPQPMRPANIRNHHQGYKSPAHAPPPPPATPMYQEYPNRQNYYPGINRLGSQHYGPPLAQFQPHQFPPRQWARPPRPYQVSPNTLQNALREAQAAPPGTIQGPSLSAPIAPPTTFEPPPSPGPFSTPTHINVDNIIPGPPAKTFLELRGSPNLQDDHTFRRNLTFNTETDPDITFITPNTDPNINAVFNQALDDTAPEENATTQATTAPETNGAEALATPAPTLQNRDEILLAPTLQSRNEDETQANLEVPPHLRNFLKETVASWSLRFPYQGAERLAPLVTMNLDLTTYDINYAGATAENLRLLSVFYESRKKHSREGSPKSS